MYQYLSIFICIYTINIHNLYLLYRKLYLVLLIIMLYWGARWFSIMMPMTIMTKVAIMQGLR